MEEHGEDNLLPAVAEVRANDTAQVAKLASQTVVSAGQEEQHFNEFRHKRSIDSSPNFFLHRGHVCIHLMKSLAS